VLTCGYTGPRVEVRGGDPRIAADTFDVSGRLLEVTRARVRAVGVLVAAVVDARGRVHQPVRYPVCVAPAVSWIIGSLIVKIEHKT